MNTKFEKIDRAALKAIKGGGITTIAQECVGYACETFTNPACPKACNICYRPDPNKWGVCSI